MKLYVIVGPSNNFGGWHRAQRALDSSPLEAVHAFTSERDAWDWLLTPENPDQERAMRHAWRVVEFKAGES
jgi:hypothetical protein